MGRSTTDTGKHDWERGDHAALFRSRFWVSLVFSVPVVFYSEMIQMWLGFSMPEFPGAGWVTSFLDTFVFL